MNLLLKEYLSYIVKEAENVKTPPEAEGLYAGSFGYYYHDSAHTKYAGRVVNGEWVPAASGEKAPDATATGTSAPTEPSPPSAPVAPPDKSVAAVPSTETRSVEVMGKLFSSEATTISKGTEQIVVRNIQNPETGQALDITDPAQRTTALDILNAHIASLMPKAKEMAKRMSQKKISKKERQQIRKWLGNMGELCGLRDIISAGGEAYLYADSNPKNDIAVVFEYDNGTDLRDVMVVGVSTKSSAGSQGGRKESSSLPFVMESVEGKSLQLGDEEFFAEDAAVALYAVQKLIYSSSTRGYVRRGRIFKEEREFMVPDEDLGKFDVAKLRTAQEEQQTAALRGEAGGQKKFVESRLLSIEDVDQAFDKTSRAYGRVVARVMRSMGISKEDNEGIMKASRLVDYYVDKIKQGIAQSTEEEPYRLSHTNDMLTDEVVSMLEQTNSNFSFESDLMTVNFDAATGYLGLQIVPKEVMTQRAVDRYGDLSKMSKREQLTTLANWTFNTRGLGLSSSAGGYIDILARVSPPLELLKDDDKLAVEKYLEYLRLLHISRRENNNGNQERDIQAPPAG